MVEHKIIFVVVFVYPFNISNSHIILVETQIKPRLCYIGRYVAEAKSSLTKKKKIHPDYRYLGRKNRGLGKRASPAFHMNISKFLPRKDWRDEISEIEPPRLTGFI